MISDIELLLNDSTSLFENIRSNLDIWREKICVKKQFKEEWQEFMIYARKLIQKIVQIEENFFPRITGDLGNSLDIADSYQKNLDDFMPTIKNITTEIEDCVTRAEILALNGDSQGQKDLIINELGKVKQKFLAKINEHKIFLQMLIGFFRNFHKVLIIVFKFKMKNEKLFILNIHSKLNEILKQAEKKLSGHPAADRFDRNRKHA